MTTCCLSVSALWRSTWARISLSTAVEFETDFPTAGAYRLFLQFKHGGRVHTAALTRQVETLVVSETGKGPAGQGGGHHGK